jgi:hypothetical protein
MKPLPKLLKTNEEEYYELLRKQHRAEKIRLLRELRSWQPLPKNELKKEVQQWK